MASFQLGIATDWHITLPWLLTLVVCATVDVFLGVGLAWNRLNIDSTISRKGMFRKSAVLVLVITGSVLDGLIPSIRWELPIIGAFETTLGTILSSAFIVQELTSIAEKSALLGINLPPRLVNALAKLKKVINEDGENGEEPKQA